MRGDETKFILSLKNTFIDSSGSTHLIHDNFQYLVLLLIVILNNLKDIMESSNRRITN